MALEEAKEANEAKQSFLSKMSYDIRRPVNVKDILNTLKESKYTITSEPLKGAELAKKFLPDQKSEQEFFTLFFEAAGDRILRAGLAAAAATDALGTVRCFHRVHVHLTDLCTFSAVDTFVPVNAVAEEGDLIENGIKGSQGTDILAEGPVDQDGKHNRCDEDRIFPDIQPADGSAHGFV